MSFSVILCTTNIDIQPVYDSVGKGITVSDGAKTTTTLSLPHFLTAKS